MFIDPILSCSQTKLLFMQRIHNYHSATKIVQGYQAWYTFVRPMEDISNIFHNDLLPSLGARANQSIKLKKFIISPYDLRYR